MLICSAPCEATTHLKRGKKNLRYLYNLWEKLNIFEVWAKRELNSCIIYENLRSKLGQISKKITIFARYCILLRNKQSESPVR